MPLPRILCLDFDGALHPSTEVADFQDVGLPLLAYIQTRPQLLRWGHLLNEAMSGSDCEVIVHSSWRNEVLDSDLRRLLKPSGLAERFVGSAPRNMKREAAILEVARVMGLGADELLIVDDAVDEFSALSSRLVVCNPLVGISDPAVLALIRERLAAAD